MQPKNRTISRKREKQDAERYQGQRYNNTWFENGLIPTPPAATRYYEQNTFIFGRRNRPSNDELNAWTLMRNRPEDRADSMASWFESRPEEERRFANKAYGEPDPGMMNDLIKWRDKLFSSPWGSQYSGLEHGGRFEQLRADWNQNRKAYTPETSAAHAYAVLMAVQDRNERIIETPAFKRGKLTEIDFLSDSDESY